MTNTPVPSFPRSIRPRPTGDPPPSWDTRPIRPNTLYLCQVCGNVARYPRLKSHTFRLPFGYAWTVDYVTPMVCTTCRINRQDEATRLGDGRRRFWKRAVAIWLGEPYPSIGPRMFRLMVLRFRLARAWRRFWHG